LWLIVGVAGFGALAFVAAAILLALAVVEAQRLMDENDHW